MIDTLSTPSAPPPSATRHPGPPARRTARGAWRWPPMALAGIIAMLLVSAGAQPRTVDAIAAIVNDDVVLVSEVMERYQALVDGLRAQGRTEIPPRDAVLGQILERLILENIQMQEAERRGIVLDDETLTAAVREYASQNGMDIDVFIRALDDEGLSYRGFREQVRRQLTIDRVQREVVNRRVYITEQDVKELIASPFFAEQISDEYHIGHILLAVEPGTSKSALEAARANAERLAAELREGADFTAMAVKHSTASTALEGGDLGWRKASRIPSLFAEQVPELDVGGIIGPLRNASGFHLVKLLDKRGASQHTANETLVRHILLQPSAIRTDAETRAAIDAIHAELIDGGDFAQLAKQHSEDPGSALVGGELGWSAADQFVAVFQEAMAATTTGELSRPFRTEFGWHVLEVQDRRQQDASDEARRNYATRILHAQRFEERLQEWLTEIRGEAFVEQRLELGDAAGDPNGAGS